MSLLEVPERGLEEGGQSSLGGESEHDAREQAAGREHHERDAHQGRRLMSVTLVSASPMNAWKNSRAMYQAETSAASDPST